MDGIGIFPHTVRFARKAAAVSAFLMVAMLVMWIVYRERVGDLEKQFQVARNILKLATDQRNYVGKFQSSQEDPDGARFLEDFQNERWGEALRLVANNLSTSVPVWNQAIPDLAIRPRLASGVEGISLVNIRFADGKDQPRNFEVFLHGLATAAEPRSNADAFRQGIDAAFRKSFPLRAPCDFLNLKDLPDKTVAGRTRHIATFDLTLKADYKTATP